MDDFFYVLPQFVTDDLGDPVAAANSGPDVGRETEVKKGTSYYLLQC
jgi:hypothetical protein